MLASRAKGIGLYGLIARKSVGALGYLYASKHFDTYEAYKAH